MLWVSVAPLFERAISQWEMVDARHFVNFLSWQIAVSVYPESPDGETSGCLVGDIAFQTQPLLFGHAFINQKDLFMAFFSIWAVGLNMVDRLGPAWDREGCAWDPPFPRLCGRSCESWRAMDGPSKRRATALALASASILLARWLADSALRP
jgi:hypothetical protein